MDEEIDDLSSFSAANLSRLGEEPDQYQEEGFEDQVLLGQHASVHELRAVGRDVAPIHTEEVEGYHSDTHHRQQLDREPEA